MSCKVSVVLLTFNRPTQVIDAIYSIFRQDMNDHIEVLIGADRCNYVDRLKSIGPPENRSIHVNELDVPLTTETRNRCSIMRNMLANQAQGEFIAFLDDDNRFESSHFSSLLSVISEGNFDAAHSWRKVIDSEGNPFYFHDWVWGIGEQKQTLFDYHEKMGMVERGSDILKGAAFFDGGIDGNVDTSEWLIKREIFLKNLFPESRTEEEIARNYGEDELLLRRMNKNGVHIGASKKATLIYRLGGYSNDTEQQKLCDGIN